MITIEEAIEIVKESYGGACVVYAYADSGDFWKFGVVDDEGGQPFIDDGRPIVWKADGRLDDLGWFLAREGTPLGIGLPPPAPYDQPFIPVPGREEYRERFNRVSMQETGEPYKFPDEWEE